MKKFLPLLLTLTISAALLMGCAVAARSMEDTEADTAYEAPVLQPEIVALADVPVERAVSTASAVFGDLCAVCADEDCDGGKTCNNAEERDENKKSDTLCGVCGNTNCDGGTDCGAREDSHNHKHGGRHGNHHH